MTREEFENTRFKKGMIAGVIGSTSYFEITAIDFESGMIELDGCDEIHFSKLRLKQEEGKA